MCDGDTQDLLFTYLFLVNIQFTRNVPIESIFNHLLAAVTGTYCGLVLTEYHL